MSVYVRGAAEGHKRTHLKSSHQGGGGGQVTGGVRATPPRQHGFMGSFRGPARELLCWIYIQLRLGSYSRGRTRLRHRHQAVLLCHLFPASSLATPFPYNTTDTPSFLYDPHSSTTGHAREKVWGRSSCYPLHSEVQSCSSGM